MYKLLPVIASEEARAEDIAMKDRIKYQKFVEAAERFAVEKELISGGVSGIRLLLGADEDPASPPKPDLDSFQRDYYSGQAAAAARALGDKLYQQEPNGLGHYTTVLSKVPGYHFAIEVDGRAMFTVTSLPMYRGVKIADVVIPSYRPAQFARRDDGTPLQIACLGPELQLMELYAALCNPGRAADWSGLLTVETRLRALFESEIRGKLAEAVRAKDGGRMPSPHRVNFYKDIYSKFATGPGRILIGPAAIQLLQTGELPQILENRPQFLSMEPLEAEAKELSQLAGHHGLELQWSVNDPKIPIDPRLRRLTLYLVGGDRREPILDIYNTAAHELVPYALAQSIVRGGRKRDGRDGRVAQRRDKQRHDDRPHPWSPPANLKIGTPFVLLRFRLADLWTIQVLVRMETISTSYAKSVLREMLDDYEAAAAVYETLLQDPQVSDRLLPLTLYVGRLEAPDLALKRAALDRPGARFQAPYLPAARAESPADEST